MKVAGAQFGGLVRIPSDPTVDPPPRTCFNFWKPGHGRNDCPEPQGYFCYNCGRRGEDLRSCPRCAPVHLPRKHRGEVNNDLNAPEEVAPSDPVFVVTIPARDKPPVGENEVPPKKKVRRNGRGKGGKTGMSLEGGETVLDGEVSTEILSSPGVSTGPAELTALNIDRVRALSRLTAALRGARLS